MAARRNTEMNCKSCSIPGRSRFDGAFVRLFGMVYAARSITPLSI